MAAELDYRKVIRKLYSKLIEDLDPQPILDQFYEKDFLPATTIRDIQELRSTSEKNRAIVDKVLTKGLSGYRNFKKFLRNAHQGFLAESLDKMEKKVQDDQKLKPILQDNPRNRRTNISGQHTVNIGGDDSKNVFGGDLKIKGDVNIKPREHLNRGFGNRDMNFDLTQPHGVGDGGPVTINRGGAQSMNIYAGKVEITGNLNLGGGQVLPHSFLQSEDQHVSAVPNSGYVQETQLPGLFSQLRVNQPVGQVTGQTDQREPDDEPVNQAEAGRDGDCVDALNIEEDDAASNNNLLSVVPETSPKQIEDDGRIQIVDSAWIEHQIKNNSEELASGGTGNVYLLKDTNRLGCKVVVKKIERKTNINPIIQEIVAARIRHHAIVPLLAKGKSDKHYFFVFPYVEKGELMTAIENDTKEGATVQMNAHRRVLILYQIACAMLYIHTPVAGLRNRLVHGDITSRNIVLDGNYNPRLLDFGNACELELGQESVKVKTGRPLGTPGYTTFSSAKEYSTKTDCRNFGVLILEMLTGLKPLDGNKELQTETINQNKIRFKPCFKKIWETEKDLYNKLKKMAEKCKQKTINASEITEELYDILQNFNQDITGGLGDTNKCSLCMLNKSVDDNNLWLQDCLDNLPHVAPPVCVACMRNSYLNPIQCRRCRKTIPTKIGHSWAAILVEGYDEDENYRKGIKKDVENMKKILTSKYPLVTGLSEGNVITTGLLGLSEAIEDLKKLEESTTLFTIIVYYSGHHTTSSGFQVGEKRYFEMDKFKDCLNKITKKEIILIMDCCFGTDLNPSIPNIKFQMNASSPDEEASFKSKGSEGSEFTNLFVETLLKNSTDSCHNGNSDFIYVVDLFHQIDDQMEIKRPDGGSSPTMRLKVQNKWDLRIGYTHHTTGIDFHYAANDKVIPKIHILNTIEELRAVLLNKVLEDKYKVDFFQSHGDTLTTYSSIIAITIRKGPDEKDIHELSSIEEVTRVWDKKFELSFEIRNLQNIHNNNMVGVFLDKCNSQDILHRYLKHFGEMIVENKKEIIVKVQWTEQDETLNMLYELEPTDKQTEDAAYQWLCQTLEAFDENRNIKAATHVVFTVPPPGLWKKDAADFLTIKLANLKLA